MVPPKEALVRKLVTSTFVTLDGVMQAPGGPEEDPSGGFAQGGWSVNYWDELMGQVMDEASSEPFDLLLGRKTYEIFAAHWPYSNDEPMAGRLNRATKYVVSSTLRELAWTPSHLITPSDAPSEIARLKEQEGPEIQVHGSSQLIQLLLAHDLVDEMRVWIFPVVVGPGKRLFGQGTQPRDMPLVATKMSTTGVMMNIHRPSGPIPIGSFALDQPTEAEIERRKTLAPEGDG
jgi:dihydrofolate reductase